jgi:hypothetical protein
MKDRLKLKAKKKCTKLEVVGYIHAPVTVNSIAMQITNVYRLHGEDHQTCSRPKLYRNLFHYDSK